MQTNEREIIIDHALENVENVAIVLDITSAATDLVKRINETLMKDHDDFGGVNIWHWHSLEPGRRKEIIKTLMTNSSDRTFEQNDNANKGEIIIDHALENEKNLEMTMDIIFAGYELRLRIVKTFLKKLEAFICLNKPKWIFEERDDPFRQGPRTIFVFSKKAWQGQYGIGLRSRYGTGLVAIGVHKAGENTPSIEDLKSELDEKFEIGTSDSDWVWLPKDDSSSWDYKEWKTDVHIKMYNKKAVEDIGNYLLEIVKVAEPVIDKWLEENPLDS